MGVSMGMDAGTGMRLRGAADRLVVRTYGPPPRAAQRLPNRVLGTAVRR